MECSYSPVFFTLSFVVTDISLEYCDQPEADSDCTLTVSGRPVRHVRLDCRVALVDADRPREFVLAKTKILDRNIIEESAPWFL
jgi:hypothetical protein